MDNRRDALNYEFKWMMFKAKAYLAQMDNPEDQQLLLKWLEKLSDRISHTQELITRNKLIDNLVSQLQQGTVKSPFNNEPPEGPLTATASSLLNPVPRDTDQDGSEKGPTPLINQFSPDGGSFLTAQPVPRCGAFCYLVVTSREKK